MIKTGIQAFYSVETGKVKQFEDGRLVLTVRNCGGLMERAMGIEPTALAWEARVLPLYDARIDGNFLASPSLVWG